MAEPDPHRGRDDVRPVWQRLAQLLLAVGLAAVATGAVYFEWRRTPAVAARPHPGVAAATPRPDPPETDPAAPHPARPTPSVPTGTPTLGAAALTAALNRYLRAVGVDLSVAVRDRRTGLSYTYRPAARYATASIVKLDVLGTLLLQAQDDGRELTGTEDSLARSMIESSDNDAATTLWNDVGGADAITDANRRMGLTQTSPDPDGYWGDTLTTAADRVRLLGALTGRVGPLNGASTAYARILLANVESDQAWGVTAAARTGESTIVKNGWWQNDDGGWIVNSVGAIDGPHTHVDIAVLSVGSSDQATGIEVVEHVAELTRRYLGW